MTIGTPVTDPGPPTSDREWLDRAVSAAADNVGMGGGPFGALIVRDGVLIASGVNQVTSSLDPTAHAEVMAIRTACRTLASHTLTGCLLVASCEPCPLCLSAALWARVDRVIFAADRHDAAVAGFDDRDFYEVFATPRGQWPLTVEQIRADDSTRPFERWADRADRVQY